jgi:DNA polymerase III subunit delta
MRALEWLRDPSAHPPKPVYVVYGDDVYLKREASAAIAGSVLGAEADELAVSRFDGQVASLADVMDAVRTLPFLYKRRIVIVTDADPFVTKNRKDLENYMDAPGGAGVLVLVVKSWPATTNLAQQVAAVGLPLDCNGPPEKELVQWLIHHAAQHDAVLDTDAARLLVELVGDEAGLLTTEVEKLAVYVGEARRIRRADVSRMVEAGRIETIWKTLDAATTGHGAEAIGDLDHLLASGEYPVRVLAALSTSLLKIHYAGWLRAFRLQLDEACRMAGIRDFAIEKTRRQHAHLGPSRVDRLPAVLLKADLDLKGGTMLDPRVVLEELLIWLALPRTD